MKDDVGINKIINLVISSLIVLSPLKAAAEDCSARWFQVTQVPYISSAYPEWKAAYFAYGFRKPVNSHQALRFRGDFPHSRYMSAVLYNWVTGEAVDQLLDVDIEPRQSPDRQNVNPFRPNVARESLHREYEFWVVQAGSARQSDTNTMVVQGDVENLVLLFRIYLPDNGQNASGGVNMPAATAIDDSTGNETVCPGILPTESVLGGVTPPQPPDETLLSDEVIEALKPVGAGLYPNGDNPYLAAPLLRAPDGKIAVVRFRAPTFTRTTSGTGMFTGNEQVRYWSVCLCGMKTSGTSICIHDEKATVSEDGWVKIVVGTARFVSSKPVPGWNYIPWGLHERPMLMFRQILPKESFEGSFNNVLDLESSTWIVSNQEPLDGGQGIKIEDYFASAKIYEYAPQGVYCTEAEFIANSCGL